MRDAVQRMRLERRLAGILFAGVLLLFALVRVFGGHVGQEPPVSESPGAAGSVPVEAAGQP